MPELYGLKNCDSSRRARRWLAERGLSVRFIDLRDTPPGKRDLIGWADDIGWQSLLNRRSKTWRELPAAQRAKLDSNKACALMLAHPLLIKRPLLVHDGRAHAGFSAEGYCRIFGLQ